MDKRNWKLLYGSYEGPEKRAVDFICKEMGNYILRDKDIYSFHILGCWKAEEEDACDTQEWSMNAVVVGTYENNPVLKKFLTKEEIPANGYVVKVMDNPLNTECKLVLICGDGSAEIFYGAVDYVDDYFAYATPMFDNIHLEKELFCQPLPDYYIATAPDFKTRSVFTWGHPLAQLQPYMEDLARMKLNQVIIWNDYLPVNAAEVVECAHSYGIEVIWGFSWGWTQRCNMADLLHLEELRDSVLEEYRRVYKGACGDGIYFQSFTELSADKIGDISIAQAVTRLVNMTAAAILEEEPDLLIQFGLHATSVRKHMEDIAQVDPRVQILWEDCGSFPYKQYHAVFGGYQGYDNIIDQERYEDNVQFTDQMLDLRENVPSGLVHKCQLTMDWSRGRVKHQAGPYALGVASDYTVNTDLDMMETSWRFYAAEWIKNGRYAYDLFNHVYDKTKGDVNMCMAGMFSGGIHFATAFSSEMYWNCHAKYEDILDKVLHRKNVKF